MGYGDFRYDGNLEDDGDLQAAMYGPGARDQRLESFAQGRWGDRGCWGNGDRAAGWLALQAGDVTRPEVLEQATSDEVLGVGRAWKSLETWCFTGKLAVVRELIRRYPLSERGEPGAGAATGAGGLPDEWDPRLHHEVAAALGISVVAAGRLVSLAWTLDCRLPGISAALDELRLDPPRVKMIVDETAVLDREDRYARAEEVILAGLGKCKTWADLARMVQRAVITVDPDGARKRREQAEREHARIQFWREQAGTCALRGTGLPTDEALAATANIEARAQEYKAVPIRRPMDILRVLAYLDLINGVPVPQRAAWAQAEDEARQADEQAEAERAGRDADLREATRKARDKAREQRRRRNATTGSPSGHGNTASSSHPGPTGPDEDSGGDIGPDDRGPDGGGGNPRGGRGGAPDGAGQGSATLDNAAPDDASPRGKDDRGSRGADPGDEGQTDAGWTGGDPGNGGDGDSGGVRDDPDGDGGRSGSWPSRDGSTCDGDLPGDWPPDDGGPGGEISRGRGDEPLPDDQCAGCRPGECRPGGCPCQDWHLAEPPCEECGAGGCRCGALAAGGQPCPDNIGTTPLRPDGPGAFPRRHAKSAPCPECGGAGGIGLPARANLTVPMGALEWLAEWWRHKSRGTGGVGPGAGGSDGGGPGRIEPGSPVPESGYRGGTSYCLACGDPGSGRVPVPRDLVLPLLTLLGLADRPGEAHGLGALDPALIRDLATAGARHPRSELCVTVLDEHGYAIGHGCCKPLRGKGIPADPGSASYRPNASFSPSAAFAPSITFTPSGRAGPDGGFGSWLLAVPGAPMPFTVDIDVVPTHECDHRYASSGYQPGGRLRHLVQVRDGTCSFPACSRHARESDFEHAQPFDKGGRTCACNAHACSRSCHRVKQSTGWQVSKPRPGWTQWTTMTGRSYTQGPWRYPA